MFKPMLFASIVVLFGVAAWSASGPLPRRVVPASASAQQSSNKANAQALARAKQIYGFDCAACHGANGNGKTDLAAGMNLTLADWTDPKTLAGKSDDELFKVIRNGKGQMPSEPAGRASDSEVKSLILYIRSMAKQPEAAAPAEAH
ncbi:MAG: c-type cytochrome [Terracidiphilus sp.]